MNGNRFDNQPFNVGGGGFAGGGDSFGFGGGGIGLIALLALLGRGRGGLFGGNEGSPDLDASGIAAKVVELQNSANIRAEVAESEADILSALQAQSAGLTQQHFTIAQSLADINKNAVVAALEAKIATLQSTNELKTDINALSVKTDMQSCEILRAINADGDATRALINVNTVNDLRDELLRERRRSDSREIEINVTQTNQQLQNQMQAQFQIQRDDADRRFNALFSQQAKAGQDIIAVGSLLTGTTQTASPVNVRS